jgi:hypothetical protein
LSEFLPLDFINIFRQIRREPLIAQVFLSISKSWKFRIIATSGIVLFDRFSSTSIQ